MATEKNLGKETEDNTTGSPIDIMSGVNRDTGKEIETIGIEQEKNMGTEITTTTIMIGGNYLFIIEIIEAEDTGIRHHKSEKFIRLQFRFQKSLKSDPI